MHPPKEQLVQSLNIFAPNPPQSHRVQVLECRICLEAVRDPERETISPCKCAGSVAHVHFDCLGEWISKNHKVPIQNCPETDFFPCEMCKTNISFETEKKIKCLSKNQCADNCKQKKFMLCLLLLVCVSSLGLFVFGMMKVVGSNLLMMAGGAWFESILIISGLLVIFTIYCLSTYVLLVKFIIVRKAKIVKIGQQAKQITRSTLLTHSDVNLVTLDHKIRNSQLAQTTLEDMQ